MNLIISPTSPYARKARIVCLEKGLGSRVQIIETNPFAENSAETNKNPLGKVPCLVLPDGSVLYDSPVICAYLDEEDGNPTITAPNDGGRWSRARAHALGDGIMDAAFNIVMEKRRDDTLQSPFWLQRWEASIESALDAMLHDVEDRGDQMDIGAIACAVALSYLDFRLPTINWRRGRTRIDNWHSNLSARRSFIETRFE